MTGHASMTSFNPSEHDPIDRKSDMADVIVKGAIALVTAAIFLGAYLQFKLPIWQALLAAIGVCVALLVLHSLVRRSERVEVLATEVKRLESEVANLTGQSPGPGPLPEPRWQVPPAVPAASLAGLAPVAKSNGDTINAPAGSHEPVPQRDAPVIAPPELPSAGLTPPPAAAALPRAPAPPKTTEPARWPDGTSVPIKDVWAFRPASGPPNEKSAKRDEAPQPSGQSETDLDALQGMLKKLAKEVDVAGDKSGKTPTIKTPTSEQRQESALMASVDALHSAAESMRTVGSKVPLPTERAHTQEAKGPLPPPIAPVHARLSALSEAINANRVDVLLDPILGLADAKTHHHEVVLRLRDPRGAILPGSPRDTALSKTGLTPLLDCARMRRAAEVAASLSKTGHKASVFVATTADSLDSNQFLDALVGAYQERRALAGELVLFFSQSDVAAFSATQWQGLTELRALGFCFGLEDVSDFGFEFTRLSAAGFAFLKLGADVFRKGLPAAGGLVPANDICRYLGGLGLTVIVDDIDREAKRTTARDFNVPLGQGPLIGGPQAIVTPRLAGGKNAAA